MRRRIAALLAGVLACTTASVLVAAPPAGAGVGIGTNATQINVIITGNAIIKFACVGGKAAVTANGTTTVATPNLACSAVTKAVVAADSANQTIDARGLDDAAFSSHPFVFASLAAGTDGFWDTAQADDVNLGDGPDTLFLNPLGVTNTNATMGAAAGADTVQILSPVAGGTATAATPTNTDLVVTTANGSGTHVNTIVGVESAWFVGDKGNDTMNSAGITVASPVDQLRFDAGAGNDVMTTGAVGAGLMFGNAGSNTFNTGTGFCVVLTDSDTDTIHLGGPATVMDTFSLRSGGRTVSTAGANQGWSLNLPHGDAVARVRTGPGGGTVLTASIDRLGQQVLPPTVNSIGIGLYDSGLTNPADHGLIDVEAQAGKTLDISGTAVGGAAGNIADITIPSGAWTTTGTASPSTTLTVTPTGGYGKIDVEQMSAASVHGPWPSANASFAHRITRDLVFRFPSDSERTLLASQLTTGHKTRPQVITGLMDTDEYRSLDVNRTFLDFLKRKADPSGLAYWVNALDGGRSLLVFRAQLFGSNEYFTKAGSSNLNFLLHAYADVFGRAPDAGGQAFWLSRLNGGIDRGIVARTFLASTDARRGVSKDLYLRFLNRFPTTAEADAAITRLARPQGEQELIGALTASAEYLAEP